MNKIFPLFHSGFSQFNIGNIYYNYQNRRITKIAGVLADELNALPRKSIEEAQDERKIQKARRFIKRVKKQYQTIPAVKKLKTELIAAKLGIEADTLKKNKGFKKFASNYRLDRYLLQYKHRIKVDEKKNIKILYLGKYVKWSKVKDEIEKDKPPPCNFEGNPRQPWIYGKDGVQNKDMYAWTVLEPFKIVKKEEMDWDGYIFEFCVYSSDSIRLNGDHTWLRLKTPKGEVYSLGLYRPGKRRTIDNFNSPMRVKKGYLMSPDVSEFWPEEVFSIAVQITKKQFKTIVKAIEKDKEHEDQLYFQLSKGNCTEYVTGKAALIDIHLPTRFCALIYIIPKRGRKIIHLINPFVPKIVKKIILFIGGCIMNFFLYVLGDSKIDKKVKENGIKITPHMTKISDILNFNKLYFHPPRIIMTLSIKIKDWQDAHGEKFTLPPKDYLDSLVF